MPHLGYLWPIHGPIPEFPQDLLDILLSERRSCPPARPLSRELRPALRSSEEVRLRPEPLWCLAAPLRSRWSGPSDSGTCLLDPVVSRLAFLFLSATSFRHSSRRQ